MADLTDTLALCRVSDLEELLGCKDDGSFGRVIQAVSLGFEHTIGYGLRYQAVTGEKHPGTAYPYLSLKRAPIDESQPITVRFDTVEVVGETVEVDSAKYGQLFFRNSTPFTGLMQAGAVYERAHWTGRKSIQVDYTAGYVLPNDSTGVFSLPADLQQAAVEAAASVWKFQTRDRSAQSERLGPYQVAYGTSQKDAIAEQMHILQRYKRVLQA